MLHVLICEDDPHYRSKIESIVKSYIATEDVRVELALSTDNPEQVLEYLNKHTNKRSLYFLDIDLRHEIDGITLGAKIREIDRYAKIVFITTHDELAYLTFKYKVAALDYIVKNSPGHIEMRTIGCITTAYERYLQEKSADPKYFKTDAGSEVWKVPHNDILFFETHPLVERRVVLHTETGKVDFRGALRDVAKLVPEFYRCHQSYIVNPSKIVRIEKSARIAVLVDGTELFVAEKKMSELARMIGN